MTTDAKTQKLLRELREITGDTQPGRYCVSWLCMVNGRFQSHSSDFARLSDALKKADELLSRPLPPGDYIGACPRIYGTAWSIDCGQGIISARTANGDQWQWLRYEHSIKG